MENIKQEFAAAIPGPADRATLQNNWGYENIKRAFIGANELEADPQSAFRLALQNKLQEIQNQAPVTIQVKKADGTTEEVDLVEAVARLNLLADIQGSLPTDFTYTDGKVTKDRDPNFGHFVKASYGALVGKKKCFCLLTNMALPKSNVIASHLFKHTSRESVSLIGIDDIDDVRNALPLWRPVEWAYNSSRLSIIYKKETDLFVAKILDPMIMAMRLDHKGAQLMGSAWKAPSPQACGLTFGDLDGAPLQFAPGNLLRPARRALNFQARRARQYALRQGWIQESWNFEDFYTEGLAVSDKVAAWLNTMK